MNTKMNNKYRYVIFISFIYQFTFILLLVSKTFQFQQFKWLQTSYLLSKL